MINLRAKFSFAYSPPVRRQVLFCIWYLTVDSFRPRENCNYDYQAWKLHRAALNFPVFDSVHPPELGQLWIGLLDKGERSWVSSLRSKQTTTDIHPWLHFVAQKAL